MSEFKTYIAALAARFAGKKTYIASAVGVVYAAAGWYLGEIAQPEALNLIFEAVVAMTLRHGIAKA